MEHSLAKLTRRTFILTTAAAAGARFVPNVARSPKARHIVTLVYDKGLGMMRVIDRVVP